MRERETDLCPLIQSATMAEAMSAQDQEPDTPSESPILKARLKRLDHFLLLSHGHLQIAGSEMEPLGLEKASLWNTSIAGGGLISYARMPAP